MLSLLLEGNSYFFYNILLFFHNCYIIFTFSSLKAINRTNLSNEKCETQSFLGKGAFGSCTKMKYKGIEVAVKSYGNNVRRSDVEHEANVINLFDHPGNYLLPF